MPHKPAPKRHRSAKKSFVLIVVLCCVIAGATTYRLMTDSGVTSNKSSSKNHSQRANGNEPTPSPTVDEALNSKLKEWVGSLPGTYAISLQEVSGQKLRSANLNAEAPMVPASSYKLYVAYAVLLDVQNGKRSLSDMTYDGTIDDCLTRMIVKSDNEAGRALGFLLGWQNINQLLAEQGMTHTDLNNYVGGGTPQPTGDKHTTAADMSLLLTRLANGTLLSKTYSDKLLGLMSQQEWRERIPAGVPAGVSVADKPGWLAGIQTDAAIVYAPSGTFVLVILSTASSPAPLATLTSNIYSYLQS